MTSEWLPLGLKLLALREAGDDAGWQAVLTASKSSAQTFHRFMRIAAFLSEHFKEALDTGQIKAGSAVMLEFMQLYEIDREAAMLKAPQVLAGNEGVLTLREERRKRQQAVVATNKRLGHHTQRYTSFSAKAVSVLMKNNDLLGTDEKIALRPSSIRDILEPKLSGITHDGHTIAVDIKAPDPSAARTESTTAAALAARIAVLLLKYDRVVVVVPANAEAYARATLDLLGKWASEAHQVLGRVGFLVMDLDTPTSRLLR